MVVEVFQRTISLSFWIHFFDAVELVFNEYISERLSSVCGSFFRHIQFSIPCLTCFKRYLVFVKVTDRKFTVLLIVRTVFPAYV